VVGSTIPIAVGIALGSVMRGEQQVTVAFFGDAAIEEGVFHESINFAVLKKLPVVFVCENNLYSVYSHISVRQPAGREIFSLVRGHGLESYQGDGNDIVEVYDLAGQAIHNTRQGGGPTFLEFKTYRWLEHCGPNYDNDLGYRTESEFLKWKQQCPVETLKERLFKENTLSQHDVDSMINDFETETESAVKFAKESPFPEEQLLLEHIYAP